MKKKQGWIIYIYATSNGIYTSSDHLLGIQDFNISKPLAKIHPKH